MSLHVLMALRVGVYFYGHAKFHVELSSLLEH